MLNIKSLDFCCTECTIAAIGWLKIKGFSVAVLQHSGIWTDAVVVVHHMAIKG
jgi:hypothetical protein